MKESLRSTGLDKGGRDIQQEDTLKGGRMVGSVPSLPERKDPPSPHGTHPSPKGAGQGARRPLPGTQQLIPD